MALAEAIEWPESELVATLSVCSPLPMRLRWLPVVCILLSPTFAATACVLGEEQEPGCRSDADCGDDFSCRAGACFRITGGRSPPHEPADAGDGAADTD